MDNQKVFGNALMGFDKKAVIDYIYEQDSLYKNQIKDFERQINTHENMTEKIKTLEKEKVLLAISKNEIKEKLDGREEDCRDLKMTNSMMVREIEQLKFRLNSKEGELKLQMEINRTMGIKLEESDKNLQMLVDACNKRKKETTYHFDKKTSPIKIPQECSEKKPQIENPMVKTKNNKEFVENVNITLSQFKAKLEKLK